MTIPEQQFGSVSDNSLVGAYASSFLLTLTNAMTIMSFAAVFTGLGLANTGGDYVSARVLVLGVFLGSILWWFLLVGIVGLFREKFSRRGLLWVNRIAGFIITGFGLFALISLAL